MFEDQYMPVLHTIESVVVHHYLEDPTLSDFDVMAAYEAAISHYTADVRGVAPRPIRLKERQELVFDHILAVCEFLLGRSEGALENGKTINVADSAVSADEVVACLKRVLKSAKKWTKYAGSQGYVKYIAQFIPG